MSPRFILTLGVLTLLALTAALLLTRPSDTPVGAESQPLIPGLRAVVNEIEAVDVVAADGGRLVSLRRERERWRVAERDGYEADFELVHDLLRTLAAGHRASPRTSNPAWYARLGLVEPGQPAASGMMLVFPGTDLPRLIVGQLDGTGQGHFVRLADDVQSWLSDVPIDLPDSTAGWLERSVMDIPARELAEVTILHPDGDTIQLRSADEAGEQWVLMNVPEDRDAAEAWQLRPVANGLANVSMEDVASFQGAPDSAVRALYRTHDGLNFLATLFEDDAGAWVHFAVSAEVAASDSATEDATERELLIDAAAVDERLSPWQFRVPMRKYENMTRRHEQLLKPVG
jgi:hypothetical protein